MSLVLVSDREWPAQPKPGLACSSLANRAGSMAQIGLREVGQPVEGLKAKDSLISTSSTISHRAKGDNILDTSKDLVKATSTRISKDSRGTGNE